MRNFLFIILIIFISCQKNEDSVPSNINPEDLPEKVFAGDLIKPTLTELQSFFDQNFTKVVGDIQLTNLDYLTDLSLLIKLRSIEGDLWIGGLELENLEGLNNLERIDGQFYLAYINSSDLTGLNKLVFVEELILRQLKVNDLSCFDKLEDVGFIWLNLLDIKDLSGLNSLKTYNHILIEVCNKMLSLEGANSLKNLNGSISVFVAEKLEKLNINQEIEIISGSLRLSHCPNLIDLKGLSNLKTIENDLMLMGVGIDNFEGFENLEDINGSFTLYNDSIKSFTGLNNLMSIGNNFSINECHRISNLVGLNSVDSIGGEFRIQYNENLSNLEGFNSSVSHINEITIVENFQLTDFCSLSDFIISVGPDYNCVTIPNAYNPVFEDFINGDCSE